MDDVTKTHGYKSTELWLTTISGVVSTILASTAPSQTTTYVVVGLVTSAVTYILCRTAFKIAKLKYRPNDMVAFSAPKTDDEAA